MALNIENLRIDLTEQEYAEHVKRLHESILALVPKSAVSSPIQAFANFAGSLHAVAASRPKCAEQENTVKVPPDDLPIYRLLTGPDDAEFCHRVSEALALGYLLYGSPALTSNDERVIVAQAVIWPYREAVSN